ncbi:tetratricopeptide repeat protein [Neptuniibacter sp. QD57_21]|uniref:tetratricopeptide repeat protein n=1 Tax=Neptuniibacter sp. QD57_21 TaxID=3398213 RepID=UPI0039F4E725
MSQLPPPENQPEFTCVKEVDNLPPLEPELETRYQEIRSQEKQNKESDWENLNNQYQYLAEQGHWKAASRLAYRHIKGIGGPRSYSKAFKWYQHLADQNIPQGYYNLAAMAEKGLGVDQDKEKAWAYLHRAAQTGSPHAQYRLGEIYLYPRNDDRMGELYHRCALSQGHAKSARALGVLADVQRNYPKMLYFTQVAASMGIEGSMLKVLQVFRDGDYGYIKDEKLAHKYDHFLTMLENDESLAFPDLAKQCPLPSHPTMGLYNPETDQNEMPE